MSQLVAFYDEKPVELKGRVEIDQVPMVTASRSRSTEGAVRPSLIYVVVPSEAGPFLVPFGEYDEWSLRDRYNEAIRIMNTLGASVIVCESFRELRVRRGVRALLRGHGAELTQQRLENSGFDFRHNGAGSAPRDPRPLRWSHEPGFSAAVSSVLENRATEVVINIKTNRTHDVEGSLAGFLKDLGFDLGGGTQQSDGACHPQCRCGQLRSTRARATRPASQTQANAPVARASHRRVPDSAGQFENGSSATRAVAGRRLGGERRRRGVMACRSLRRFVRN